MAYSEHCKCYNLVTGVFILFRGLAFPADSEYLWHNLVLETQIRRFMSPEQILMDSNHSRPRPLEPYLLFFWASVGKGRPELQISQKKAATLHHLLSQAAYSLGSNTPTPLIPDILVVEFRQVVLNGNCVFLQEFQHM